jgi:predicted nucleic acid-binding protein
LILADASVWIDHFRGLDTSVVASLRRLLNSRRLGLADLTITEVLQGFNSDADHARAETIFQRIPVIDIGGQAVAFAAARNYRTLRARGITVRRTIDTLIATCCIVHGHGLLYADRDFDPFVEHLGLQSANV